MNERPTNPFRRSARRGARPALLATALLVGGAAGAIASPEASARERVRAERLTVYAEVVDVRPVYREVRRTEPTRECWTEERRTVVREGGVSHGHRERRRSGGDALVGGVIGGVIGNQLGRGASRGGRAGATIAGAIVGSAIANEASAGSARHRRHRPAPSHTVYETRPVERCRTVEVTRSEERLQHYDVTYRYDGRTYTTRLPRDPGSTIELNVTLTPARR